MLIIISMSPKFGTKIRIIYKKMISALFALYFLLESNLPKPFAWTYKDIW